MRWTSYETMRPGDFMLMKSHGILAYHGDFSTYASDRFAEKVFWMLLYGYG